MTNNELAGLLEEAARTLRGNRVASHGRKGSRVTVAEFAASNDRHIKTVQGMCRKGVLVARQVGRTWQIDAAASDRGLSLKYGNAAERDLARRK